MLVISRKANESIVIADQIVVTVVEIRGDKVRLGVQAPRDAAVHRHEVHEAIRGHALPQPPRPATWWEPPATGADSDGEPFFG